MERGSLTEALRETLALFEEGGAPRTTTEVAGRLDLGRRSTYERLERLVENGRLDTKKVGGNGRVWWRPPTDSTDSSLTSPSGEKSVRATTDFTDKGQQFELLVDAASEYAIFLLNPDGRVLTWNEGAHKIKGYDGKEIVGEHFSRFYTDDDRAAGVPDQNLAAAIDQGHIEDEGWRVRADGSRFWAIITITALRDETGELTGFTKITRDMTGQRERERQLRRERDLIERVFETSPVGLGILTPDGLEHVNARAAEIYGSATSDVDDYVVGNPEVYDSNGRKVPLDERPNARVFETGDPVYGWECQLEAADGVRRWLSVSASPLTGHDGAVERVVVATEDITRLKEQARILERKRNALETELDEVFERVDDAFVALDNEWRITYLNEEAEHFLQWTKEELLGRVVSEEFPEIVGSTFEREFKRAMETQDAVTVEEFYPPLDSWLEVHAYPSKSGLSVYFRDVSERRAKVREVAEYETIVETMRDGVYVLDEELRFAKVNDAYCELTGYAREDLIGAHSSLVVGDDVTQESANRLQEAIARGGGATLEADILRADGSRLRAESNFTALPGSDAGAPRKIGVVRDVSERVERERALEESERRYRALVKNFPNGGIVLLDDELRYMLAEGAIYDEYDIDKSEFLGTRVGERYSDHDIGVLLERHYRAALTGESREFEFEWNGLHFQAWALPVTDDEGTVFAVMAMTQDITERVERERELERFETILETMRDGIFVVDEDMRFTLVNDAYAAMTGYAREELIGAPTSLIVDEDMRERARAILDQMRASVTDSTVVEATMRTKDGGRLPTEATFAVLEHDDGPLERIGVMRDVTERKRHEREQRRQREQLAALNDVNDLVQEITAAAINQSTQAEIEELVCVWLADADSYESAWIGELDTSRGLVTVREKAGLEGDIDEWQIQLDDSDHSNGPTGMAFRTSEVQVAQDFLEDPDSAPGHDYARASGSRSAAAIPLAYDGVLYGVLTVYSARPDAFAPAESRVFERLGTTLGHLIRAVEQRRALMATEVVQLDLQLTDILSYVSTDVDWSGRVEVDRTIPTRDGSYVQYVTATPNAVDALSALAEFGGAITELEELGMSDEDVRFAVHYERPPLTEAIVQNAGRVVSAVMTDGDLTMQAEFPSNADIGAIIAQIEDTYPQIQMIAQRSSISIDDRNERETKTVFGELTERQRASIEAAYFAGFFDWPRKTTGEELAETMGVSSPTFHQHLRKATNTILSSLLSGDNG